MKEIMSKYLNLLFVLSLLTLPVEARETSSLLRILKEVIALNDPATGERANRRSARCQIHADGTIRYQLYQGAYRPQQDQIKKLHAPELSLFLKTLRALKNNDSSENYQMEYDFTGDQSNEMGTKFVKNEDAVAEVDGKEIRFYWMRRRLMRSYHGPESSTLRELVRKYCLMNL